MAEKLEAKSINGHLFDEGFQVVDIMSDEELTNLLVHALARERGEYFDVKIFPGEFVLEGSGYHFQDPDLPLHIVYAKFNPEHPRNKRRLPYVKAFELINDVGEGEIFPTLSGIR